MVLVDDESPPPANCVAITTPPATNAATTRAIEISHARESLGALGAFGADARRFGCLTCVDVWLMRLILVAVRRDRVR
jgi:hypothetical protein